jgi:hypothetical protein
MPLPGTAPSWHIGCANFAQLQLGDAEKYIAAGEMTTDCFKRLARAQFAKDTDRVGDGSSEESDGGICYRGSRGLNKMG